MDQTEFGWVREALSLAREYISQDHGGFKAGDGYFEQTTEMLKKLDTAMALSFPSTEAPAQRHVSPVAYRWRQPGNKHWVYDPTPEWIEDHGHEIELEALYASATPKPPAPHVEVREAIARIICPARCEDYSDDPKLSAIIAEAFEDALTKADAILSSFSSTRRDSTR